MISLGGLNSTCELAKGKISHLEDRSIDHFLNGRIERRQKKNDQNLTCSDDTWGSVKIHPMLMRVPEKEEKQKNICKKIMLPSSQI